MPITTSPAYPGHLLRTGSAGSEVARVQKYISELAARKPALRPTGVDGKFGDGTRQAVQSYQAHAGLKADGIVGADTWNALVNEHTAAYNSSADTFPGITLRPGENSQDVAQMQRHLNELGKAYTAIQQQTADGKYGDNTAAAARRFQRQFGLAADGIIGKNTWAAVVRVRNAMAAGGHPAVATPYPGAPLREGASGDNVRFLQSYLNGVRGRNVLKVDGIFGAGTKQAVSEFQAAQGLKIDGIAGSATWNRLVAAYNAAAGSP